MAISTILLVVFPFAASQNAWAEWANPFYFLSDQHGQLFSSEFPNYFINSHQTGVFYPLHLFYSGFTTLLFASVFYVFPVYWIFLLSILFAYIALYFGSYQLLQFVGGNRLASVSLALCVTVSPYLVTELYGRGAWSELMGVSFCILSIAWFLRLFKNQSQLSWLEETGFVLSTAIAVSAHNISLLLCIFLLIPIVLFYAYLSDNIDRGFFWNGNRRIWILAVSGALIPMAFTFPNLVYGRLTNIASYDIGNTAKNLSQARVLLAPFLLFPKEQQQIHLAVFGVEVNVRLFNQTLVYLLIATTITCFGILFGKKHGAKTKINALSVQALPWILIFLQINSTQWMAADSPLRIIQFPYRLTPYLTLSIALSAVLVLKTVAGKYTKDGLLISVCVIYSTLGIYQAFTGVYASPPNFERPRINEIQNQVLPSPLFRGESAATTQFRLRSLEGVSTLGKPKLNFDNYGIVRKTQEINLSFSIKQVFDDSSIPILQTGTEGYATTIGVTKKINALYIIVDVWGQSPAQIRIDRSGNELCEVTVQFDWARNKLQVSSPAMKGVINLDFQSDRPYEIQFGQNQAGSTLFNATNNANLTVETKLFDNSNIPVGIYTTNVIHSPLTKWKNVISATSSNDGVWVIETGKVIPMVEIVPPIPVAIGRILSIFGLVIALVAIPIRSFPPNKKNRNSKWRVY